MDVHLHDTSITSTLLAALNMATYEDRASNETYEYERGANTPRKVPPPNNSTGSAPADLYLESSLDGLVINTLQDLETHDGREQDIFVAASCAEGSVLPTPEHEDSSKILKADQPSRRARRKWTEDETNDLIRGCHIHGVGNWKKVLTDPRFHFNERSSVDLKDRFRTCFPKEYRKRATPESGGSFKHLRNEPFITECHLTTHAGKIFADGKKKKTKNPDTKTALHHAQVLQKLGIDANFPKVQRRERREFTGAEDARLLQGFTIYGASWARIQNDPALKLGHRRSTDLRDRFRNAYPERYISAGFKSRPRQQPCGISEEVLSTSYEKNCHDVKIGKAAQPPRNHILAEVVALKLSDSTKKTLQDDMSDNTRSLILNRQELPNVLEPVVSKPDHSPAPGSLSNDPDLDQGFGRSSLELMTVEFLAVAQAASKGDLVRWDEIATHPIFELETGIAAENGDTLPIPEFQSAALTAVKRRAAQGFGKNPVIKRLRAQKSSD